MNRKFYILGLIATAISLIFIIYLYFSTRNTIQKERTSLIDNANAHFINIKNARTWNAKYANIYSDNPNLAPNPYLPNNTLKDIHNRQLVKINPAWMTRQLSQLLESKTMHFAIVSNLPLNPNNQATGFFKEALNYLEKQNHEEFAYKFLEEKKELQFIGALRVSKECLKCHGSQGYKIGDLRGGIAITLDAAHYFDTLKDLKSVFYIVVLIVFAMWSVFLVLIYKWLKKHYEVAKINQLLDKKVKSQTQKLDNLNKELQRYNNKLSNVIDGSNLGYWDWELDSNKYYVNQRWLEILHLTRSNVTNTINDFINRLHPIDKSHIMPKINKAIEEDVYFNVEFRMMDKNGNYVWIEASGAVVERDSSGKALRLSGTHQDISKRKSLESIRNKNREYLNILFDNNPNIVVVTNAKEILSTNHQFFRYFPEFSSIKEFKKHYSCICDLFEEVDDKNFLHPSKYPNWVNEAIGNPDSKVLIKYHENLYYFKVIASLVKFDGEMLYITTFTDITQQQLLQKRLEEISIKDELTNLYNRRHFNHLFKEEYNKAKVMLTSLTFVMLDLDNFKLYNDNYGHDKGDSVLEKVGKELQSSLKRSSDSAFRLGGEEFGVLFKNLDYVHSIEYANSIRQNIAALEIEHEYNQPYGKVTVSVGLCFVDFESDEVDIKDIYHYADQALYESKSNGRNVVSSWRLN
ncbi:MAG: diguanylate cyclase [Campylobacterales bacterium]|nr:diguanylate cyclase [Campylobacterales bacterium]